MPLYEFTCRECGAVFEEIVSLAELEAGEVACPACGSASVERGLSTFSTRSGGGAGSAGGVSGAGCGGGGFT
jgi:putative FmdB family regulatory protein